MSKFLHAILALVLVGVVLPIGPAHAQDPLTLDATYEDETGFLSFSYPSSWSLGGGTSFDPSRALVNAFIFSGEGYAISFGGLTWDAALGIEPAMLTDDPAGVMAVVMARRGINDPVAVTEPTVTMFGDRLYLEVIATLENSNDGSNFLRTAGLLEVGNGYYVVTQASWSDGDVEAFLTNHVTGLAIVERFNVNVDRIPATVVNTFDPATPINTAIADPSTLDTVFVSEEGGPLNLRAPSAYDGSVYDTDFGFYLPDQNDSYAEIYARVLVEGEDYDISFSDAADFVNQTIVPDALTGFAPFVAVDFVTGINSFDFENGTYADVVYGYTYPDDSTVYYQVRGVLVANTGAVIAVSLSVDADYVEGDVNQLLDLAATLRAIMQSVSLESFESTIVSQLSGAPDAVADPALLTQPLAGTLGGFPVTIQIPAGWYGDLSGSEGSIESDNDRFGSLSEWYRLSFVVLPADLLDELGIAPTATGAEAIATVLAALPDLQPDAVLASDLVTFDLDGTSYAEFVYSYDDDDDAVTIIESVGVFKLEDSFIGVIGQLSATDVETDLEAFYQAHSIGRAMLSTLELGERLTLDDIDTTAINPTALDSTTTFEAWEDGTVVTIQHDSRWSADSYGDEAVVLYSNSDEYGEDAGSFNAEIYRVSDELITLLGVDPALSPLENANALLALLPELSEYETTILQPVQTLPFANGDAAEFVYSYVDDEPDYYIQAIVVFNRGEDTYLAISLLRVNGEHELLEFYRGQAVVRAMLDSLTVE